jgi:hypothetical protein
MKTVPEKRTQRKRSFYAGLVLIASGVLCNKWFLELTVVSDHKIETFSFILFIFLFQIAAIIIGLYLVVRQPDMRLLTAKELIAVLLSLITILVILEVGARVWLNVVAAPDQRQRYLLSLDVSTGESQWSKHPYLNYYPTPNYKLGTTSHNSLGFRGKEFVMPKPDGMYRIVVIGGSTTYDIEVDDNEKTFAAHLERLLRDEYGGKEIEVINAGAGGYSSWETLINLQFRVVDTSPDLIIFEHGYSDVHCRLVDSMAYSGDNRGIRTQWKSPAVPLVEHSAFLRIIGRLAGLTDKAGIQTFVTAPTYMGACSVKHDQRTSDDAFISLLRSNPPLYFRRNLLNMLAVVEVHGIKSIFTTVAFFTDFGDYASTPHYLEGLNENNKIIKDVAESHDILLFDSARMMPKEKRYWSDGRHLNEEGSFVKASLLADFIERSGLIPD